MFTLYRICININYIHMYINKTMYVHIHTEPDPCNKYMLNKYLSNENELRMN